MVSTEGNKTQGVDGVMGVGNVGSDPQGVDGGNLVSMFLELQSC
jgi:hypothetical protein